MKSEVIILRQCGWTIRAIARYMKLKDEDVQKEIYDYAQEQGYKLLAP